MQKGSQQLGQSMLETRFREMDYDLHVKKVTEIVESKRTRITNTVSAELKESYMNAKSGNIKFNEHVKQHNINNQNEALLCRLIEISQGRSCFFNGPEYASIAVQSSPQNQQIRPVKNLPYRQERLRLIDEQNRALAKRLLEKKSFVDHSKIKKDINEYEKLKSHMQKFKSLSSLNAKPFKLPPLFKHEHVEESSFETHQRIALIDNNSSSCVNVKIRVNSVDTKELKKPTTQDERLQKKQQKEDKKIFLIQQTQQVINKGEDLVETQIVETPQEQNNEEEKSIVQIPQIQDQLSSLNSPIDNDQLLNHPTNEQPQNPPINEQPSEKTSEKIVEDPNSPREQQQKKEEEQPVAE